MRRQYKHKQPQAASYHVEGSMRIDPYTMAKHFRSGDLRSKAQELSGKDCTSLFGDHFPGYVQICKQQVLVECQLKSGLPLIVRVPTDYYKGIGARYVVSEREGNPVICILELVHDDPHLTVPVLVSTDLEDAAVDWESWSKLHNLTMLHWPLGAQGYRSLEASAAGGRSVSISPQAPRRHHAQFAQRRPRFLARRKAGLSGSMPSLAGREIIARN